jgi:hypothetical protein
MSTLADVGAEVDALFCGPGASYGNYTRATNERGERDPGEAIVPGAMFRFPLVDAERRTVSLQVYKGIHTLGGALWSREVRSLLRLSAREHPALPAILGGAYVEANDLAFVVTEAARYRLSDENALQFVASHPEEALRQLATLAHGLSLLHEQGIAHRNLHPGAIEYLEHTSVDGSDVRYSLRFSRFEMSAMLSNLVRRQLAGERLPHGDIRRVYLDQPPETLAYCPPERAEWLFSGNDSAFLESDRSDVYALGVLAWRLVVERNLAPGPSDPGDPIRWAEVGRDVGSIRTLNARLRASLYRARVARPLATLLTAMLAWDPRDRPNIVSVVRDLTHDYGRLVASLAPSDERAQHHVGFMPEPSKATIYKWGWIDQDPSTPAGLEQLRAFLDTELRGAEILYCPEGFSGFQRAKDDRELKAFRAARWVLVGKQAYWFADMWFERGPAYSRDDQRVDQLLVIKYVRHQRYAWRLSETPLRRRVPGEIRLVPVWAHQGTELTDIRARGADWKPLLRSVEFERSTPEWMQRMDDAFDFLVAFRNAELDARVFPFASEHSSGDIHHIRLDRERDRLYQFRDPLRSLYFREMRAPMGRLFQSMDAEATAPLAVYADATGRPDYASGALARVVLERRLDDDTVAVRFVSGSRGALARGWIRPDEDQGSFAQARSQEDAVEELLRSRALLHQLHAPTAIRGLRARWQGVGAGLAGRGAAIVEDMLGAEPFYALHGPPGTGKTTVASVAVAAHLRLDPSQRVLISSQSHYALDNLALRVLDRCLSDSLDVVAVRVASSHALAQEKVHPRIERLLPDRQAAEAVEVIRRSTTAALESGALNDGRRLDERLRALVSEWRAQAPRVELEIRDRIRRGANLVFATTGGSTRRNVATGGASGLYDWVIVEEAARAWPAELALPLVRGLRWTLIGDHFQLPAFDELAVRRFLEACSTSADEELKLHGERQSAYLEVFKLFGALFDKRAERNAATEADLEFLKVIRVHLNAAVQKEGGARAAARAAKQQADQTERHLKAALTSNQRAIQLAALASVEPVES